MKKTTVKEFVDKYCYICETEGYPFLCNTESSDGYINNYADLFLSGKHLNIFTTLTAKEKLCFTLDYVDYNDNDNDNLEVRCGEYVREYPNNATMGDVFRDCIRYLKNNAKVKRIISITDLRNKTIEIFTKKSILFEMTFEDLVNNGFRASRIIRSLEIGDSYRGMNFRIKS